MVWFNQKLIFNLGALDDSLSIKIVITVCSTKWNSSATTHRISVAADTTPPHKSIAMT
jgi:hypothetical protein